MRDPRSHTHCQATTQNPNLGGEIASNKISRWRTLYNRLGYVPPWCRYDPDHPEEFSLGLNILFGASILSTAPALADDLSSIRWMLHGRKPLLQSPDLERTCARLQSHI
jgi:hypothetical protein